MESKSLNDLKRMSVEVTETNTPVKEEDNIVPSMEELSEVMENENEEIKLTVNDEDEVSAIKAVESAGIEIGSFIQRHTSNIISAQDKLIEEAEVKEIEEEIEMDEEDIFDEDLESLDDEIDSDIDMDEEEITEYIPETKKDEVKVSTDEDSKNVFDEDLELLSDDMFDDEELDDEDLSHQQDMDNLKKRVAEKLKMTPKVDTNNIVISKKPVSLNSILSKNVITNKHIADWVLYGSGNLISMSSLTGKEIEVLEVDGSSRNRINALKDHYRVVYNHIVDDKPPFEEWIKSTAYVDLDSYYMALYRATFEKSNHMPRQCTNNDCGHIFLSEDIDIFDMIEFKDDKTKERFFDILNNGGCEGIDSYYDVKIIPITDTIAIGFKVPSIYNIEFEFASLPEKVRNGSGESTIYIVMCIDSIYSICEDGYRELSLKEYPNNPVKTARYKFATYSKIIDSLSPDEYAFVSKCAGEFYTKNDAISYKYPETICPKCGKKLESLQTTPIGALFNRHQLATRYSM